MMLTKPQIEDALEELFQWDELRANTEEHAQQIAEAAAKSGHPVVHGRGDDGYWFVRLVGRKHKDYGHLGAKM